jgi:hypothetical protein
MGMALSMDMLTLGEPPENGPYRVTLHLRYPEVHVHHA